MERQRVSLGKNLAGSNLAPSLTWPSDSWQGWQCHLPGLRRDRDSPQPPGTRRAGAPAPAAREGQTTAEDGTVAVAISVAAGRPQAVTPVPALQPLRPAPPTRTPGPAPRSRTPALTFPRCSALLAHSP